MNNSLMETKYVDPDPTSALFLSIWFKIVGVFGIPLNIFIVIATVKVKEIRAVSSNMFIGSLALSDALLMLSFSLRLSYALTSNEKLLKITGSGITVFGALSAYHPSFLALNRYAVVCRQQEKLAQYMLKVFFRKGIYWMIFLLWTFQIVYELSFLLFDMLGVHSVGSCGIKKMPTTDVCIRVYYYCGIFGVLALSNVPLLIFYSKVSSWVKKMSAQLSLSLETKKTVRETENVLLLTKWVTVIPFIFGSPGILIMLLLEFNPRIVSVGVGRLIVSSYPLVPLFNGIVTMKFARSYRLAFKKVCDRTTFTSILFSWMIEGRWVNNVDVI